MNPINVIFQAVFQDAAESELNDISWLGSCELQWAWNQASQSKLREGLGSYITKQQKISIVQFCQMSIGCTLP